MLIVCPSCASEYIIDPAQIGADGRTVRCAACRGTFFVLGETNVTEVELAGSSTPRRRPGPSPTRRSKPARYRSVRAAMRAPQAVREAVVEAEHRRRRAS